MNNQTFSTKLEMFAADEGLAQSKSKVLNKTFFSNAHKSPAEQSGYRGGRFLTLNSKKQSV